VTSPRRPAASEAVTYRGFDVDAVLFDLDGTLIDSTLATERAWLEWGRRLGLSGYVHEGHGLTASRIVSTQIRDPAQRQHAIDLAQELEIADVAGIIPKPGAVDLLGRLPAHRWAIVTSSSARLADVRIGAAGLPRPATIVTADDVAAGKPAPDCYALAAERLGVAIESCLVVEDTPAGLQAGASAGAMTIAVAGTYPAVRLVAGATVESLDSLVVELGVSRLRIGIGSARGTNG
jgi:mannitol-1-/sugar-/sorbitol-6-phosphatase